MRQQSNSRRPTETDIELSKAWPGSVVVMRKKCFSSLASPRSGRHRNAFMTLGPSLGRGAQQSAEAGSSAPKGSLLCTFCSASRLDPNICVASLVSLTPLTARCPKWVRRGIKSQVGGRDDFPASLLDAVRRRTSAGAACGLRGMRARLLLASTSGAPPTAPRGDTLRGTARTRLLRPGPHWTSLRAPSAGCCRRPARACRRQAFR